MTIPFSPSNPENWRSIERPDVLPIKWLNDHTNLSKDAIKTKQTLPFNPCVFKTAHLIDITIQTGCKYISFSPVLIKDTNGKLHSSVIAYGMLSHDGLIVGSESKWYVGTAGQSNFGDMLLKDLNPSILNEIKGLDWAIKENPEIKVVDWLAKTKNGDWFQTGTDFIFRARIKQENALAFLNKLDPNGQIAIYPIICWCEIDPNQASNGEKTGNFCNIGLAGIGSAGDNAWQMTIPGDTWRPNWPRTGGGNGST